tara:strand:+ start:325 stop:669 length:345 start_codon:yes stop_codon:yes gene_type:complete
MSNFTAKAFIGKISEVPTKDKDDNDDVMYFASVSIPHQGANNENKYQYIDCYVGASLKRLFASTYGAQIINDKGYAEHTLSSQVLTANIESLFFEINGEGYLAGKGILSSVSFG